MSKTPAQILAATKRTNKFKALVDPAVGGLTEAQAIAVLHPDLAAKTTPEPVDPQAAAVAELVKAGFTETDARRILGQAADPEVAETVETVQDLGEALVAQRGLAFSKGRVYVNGSIAEAIVRVLKGGGPEVVDSSGVGRVAAVLVSRQESGDVSVQNLRRPV